jgi:anti-anti-sigma regulatory factor
MHIPVVGVTNAQTVRGESEITPMRNDDNLALLDQPLRSPRRSLTVFSGPCSNRRCVLCLEGSLRTPVGDDLRCYVRGLLRRGERMIVLDLTSVTAIDAGGVSALVSAYNMAIEANGVLQVVRATSWVRQLLQRVGLFDVLSQAGPDASHEATSARSRSAPAPSRKPALSPCACSAVADRRPEHTGPPWSG